MSETVSGTDDGGGHAHEEPSGWRYWLYTTNHKVIGIIYMWLGLFFFGLAGLLALIFRTELAMSPDLSFLSLNGYNAMIGIHGLTMIVWVIPALTGSFQNYFIPLLVGTDEMAFPRWNALGAWSILFGGLLLYLPFLTNLFGLTGMPMSAGWFQYPPLNTMHATSGTDAELLASLFMIGFGSTAGGINFFTTVINERRPDMGLFDIPISVWGFGILSPVLGFYAFPWVIDAFGLQFLERNLDMAFFNARIGGDPLLYQWIWWTFGHPEVYIMVIPGMGIALEVVSRFSERPLFGYKPVVASMALVTAMSAGVWAHHMYATGLGASRYVFMVFSLAIVVAFSVFIFAALGTMYKGRVHLTTPMLFSLGSIIGLIYSGMEGIDLGQPATDIQLHSTYFVVGHFHFTLFMVGVMGLMAGIYYWYPNMTGKMYNPLAGKFHAFSTLLGLPLLFFLMSHMGELGMMRRYATYTYMPSLQFWHVLTTGAAYFVGAGQLVFFLNLMLSLVYGPDVQDNPWEELFSGQNMPSPEWDGFPYEPPTPTYVYGETAPDGGAAEGETLSDGGEPPEDDPAQGGGRS
ncbi:MAG: cbb3-type cytochrome c oxidase subunit I [Halanaeroarchaeum sp.]